jgi:hypothetical protein
MILYDNNNKEKARTLIDLEDVEKCKPFRWGINKGYVSATINNSYIFLQNYIMDNDSKFDHKDRNPLNNKKENLRPATHQENTRNITKAKNKSSDYIGIVWSKHNNKWRARIDVGYKNVIHLGYFEDIDDAIKARLEAENKYFGEFAPQKHLYKHYGINA